LCAQQDKQKRQSQALMERHQAGVQVQSSARRAKLPPLLRTQIFWHRYLVSDLSTTLAPSVLYNVKKGDLDTAYQHEF
jgi:hypothetical protein